MDSFTLFLVVSFSLVFVIGVVGNGLVWFIFHKYRSRAPNSFEIMTYYLAVIDMVTSFINPPLYMYWQITGYSVWHFGKGLCKILPLVNSVSINISIGTILIITIDRCRSIVFPFKKPITRLQLRLLVCLNVLVSIACEVPYAILLTVLTQSEVNVECFHNTNVSNVRDYQPMENQTVINYRNTFTVYNSHCNLTITELYRLETSPPNTLLKTLIHSTCLVNKCLDIPSICVPFHTSSKDISRISEIIIMLIKISLFLSIFTISNVFIYKDIQRSRRNSNTSNTPGLKSKKIFLILTWMTAVFSFLVFPKDIFYVIFSFFEFTSHPLEFKFATEINGVLKLLQTSNCCANIFIYAKLHNKFRQGVKRLSQSLKSASDSRSTYHDTLRLTK